PRKGVRSRTARCVRSEANSGSGCASGWSDRESNGERYWCNCDCCGGRCKLGVSVSNVHLDGECALDVVGVGLSVRVSGSTSNFCSSVAEAPGECVGRCVSACLSRETDRGPDGSSGWSSCEAQRQRSSTDCYRCGCRSEFSIRTC